MISSLPKWVEYGAFTLALVAGCINAIGLLGFEHQAISHLSGTATLLGTGLFQSGFISSLHLLGILMAFLLGACLAGLLLPGNSLRLGRHYGTVLVIESLLLLLSYLFLSKSHFLGHFTASAACGLQNAMVTTYSGAIVRTTHVTGIFTDLGIMLGNRLRGEPLDVRKGKLFLLIISGFVAGGAAGALLFAQIQFAALLFPATCTLLLALSYGLYAHRRRRQN